jgi:hypothetical protein
MCVSGNGLLEADCICIIAFDFLWGGWDSCGDTQMSLNHTGSTHNIRRHSTEDDPRMVTEQWREMMDGKDGLGKCGLVGRCMCGDKVCVM